MKYEPNLAKLNNHGADGSYAKWKMDNGIISQYCLTFKKGNFMLNYIGARHTTDVNSDTYKLIEQVIKKYKPKIILIEGVPHDRGIDPVLNNFVGEGSFAVSIGKQYGAVFSGIEERGDGCLGYLA